jgi:hypothetical protein
MKKIVLFLFLSIVFICCQRTQTSTTINETIKTDSIFVELDTSVVAIIPYDTIMFSGWWSLKNNVKNTELTQSDLLEIEYIFIKCITEYNIQQKQEFDELQMKNPDWNYDINHFVIDLKDYKRQYVAIENSEDEKEVWINFMCVEFENWQKDIIVVKDGGNCFFQLKINLTQKKHYDFYVNGYA